MQKNRLWSAVVVLALLLAGGLSAQPARADDYTVTTTLDSGPGSLRWAIEQANSHPGPDTIAFNIPTSDPGYKTTTGVWTIQPLSPLPHLADGGTTIDGSSQPGFSGLPIMEIEGTKAGAGLRIESADNTIRGLVINRFIMQGILIYGSEASGNIIAGNYIGTDATGASGLGSQGIGIQIVEGAHDNTIGGTTCQERNVISGNDQNGLEIRAAYNNLVIGNYIGTDASGMVALGNDWSGVSMNSGAQGNVIGGTASGEGNVISGNNSRGVYIYASGTVSNTVSGNYIGTDATGTGALGNQLGGIYIGEPTGGAQGNTIGPGNVIAHNGGNGIWVDGPDTTGNRITQNSITDNAGLGIENFNAGSIVVPPTIASVTAGSVSGIACPNCTVEIFSDPEDEGKFYEATVVADESGNFSWTGSVTGPYVTATATDASNNTSEFSGRVPLMSYVVMNTNDTGPGSLRWAVEQANVNPGPDNIVFSIPSSDPGYNPATGAWTIRPLSPLPALTDDGTTVDGTTQIASQGDTNPYGPEVEINGLLAGSVVAGLTLASADNTVRSLVINGFSWTGILVKGADNFIAGNYIGTDASGTTAVANGMGLVVEWGAADVLIGGANPVERNIISGNEDYGIFIRGETVTGVAIRGNHIGTNASGTAAVGNAKGVHIDVGAQNNVVGGDAAGHRNIISGNGWGVAILGANTASNLVIGNYIGTDASGMVALGNSLGGVTVQAYAHDNTIRPENLIAYNGSYGGVYVQGSETVRNTISRNSITNNAGPGVNNADGGNTELAPPIINNVTASRVSGTACAQCRVEIFSDPGDEGQKYEGAVIADEAGNWTWVGLATGPNVTATATDEAGNTSEFSSPTAVGYRIYLPIVLKNS